VFAHPPHDFVSGSLLRHARHAGPGVAIAPYCGNAGRFGDEAGVTWATFDTKGRANLRRKVASGPLARGKERAEEFA